MPLNKHNSMMEVKRLILHARNPRIIKYLFVMSRGGWRLMNLFGRNIEKPMLCKSLHHVLLFLHTYLNSFDNRCPAFVLTIIALSWEETLKTFFFKNLHNSDPVELRKLDIF